MTNMEQLWQFWLEFSHHWNSVRKKVNNVNTWLMELEQLDLALLESFTIMESQKIKLLYVIHLGSYIRTELMEWILTKNKLLHFAKAISTKILFNNVWMELMFLLEFLLRTHSKNNGFNLWLRNRLFLHLQILNPKSQENKLYKEELIFMEVESVGHLTKSAIVWFTPVFLLLWILSTSKKLPLKWKFKLLRKLHQWWKIQLQDNAFCHTVSIPGFQRGLLKDWRNFLLIDFSLYFYVFMENIDKMK